MVKVALIAVLLFLAMLVLSSLSALLPLGLVKPDLSAPIIVFSCTFWDPTASFLLSVVSGLLEESLSCSPPGSMVFVKVSLFLALLFLRRRVYVATQGAFLLLCTLSPAFQLLLLMLLSLAALGEVKGLAHSLLCLLADTTSTTLFSYLFFPFLNRLLQAGRIRE